MSSRLEPLELETGAGRADGDGRRPPDRHHARSRLAAPRSRAVVGLYAGAIFLSAFLLFQVEPIMGKQILPWFGGSAAVWTTAVLFFQLVLLLGYLYAHLLVRHLRPRRQVVVHIAVLAASLLVVPIVPDSAWKPTGGQEPTLRILGLLTVTVGPPFLVLSSTGPLLQAWYARRPGAFPYRLFALSNAASVLGLVSYPLLVEPGVATRRQAHAWSLAYLLFVGLAVAIALRASGAAAVTALPRADTRGPASDRPRARRRLLWVVLAAAPSLLFLAITNQLTQNVAPIPLLWVVPLSIYLFSLILCFEGRRWYRRAVFLPLLPVALGAMALELFPDPNTIGITTLIALFSVGLFVCCMVCHGELARLKPDPRHLTSFYLMVALGGAAGGLFVAVIAPLVFSGYFELPLGLVLCAALVLAVLAPGLLRRQGDRRWLRRTSVALAGGLTVALGVIVLGKVHEQTSGNRLMARNFYGSVTVYDSSSLGDDPLATREFTSGTIDHGEQFLDPRLRRRPITYFGPRSGIAVALRRARPPGTMRVGVIGLGAGTLAAYGRRGDAYSFYEINPLAVRIARTQFSFLRDSPARVRVVLGDGRLSLEREPSQHFDALAVDAFNGDSVPVHLLTKQAFALYFRHLKPTGVLAVQVTNAYLRLGPVVARAAKALGKSAVLIENDDDLQHAIRASAWVLMTGDRGIAARLARLGGGTELKARRGVRLWTDDYSNLFDALR